MPDTPTPHWLLHEGEPCWMIDWREHFRAGLKDAGLGGQMRGFHVVFRLKARTTGVVAFWDDDGSIIRRNGVIVHEDRDAHPLRRGEIHVDADDVLEVAQWQWVGGWLWGACLCTSHGPRRSAADSLLTYLPHVRERLLVPTGPMLKFFTDGRSPTRAVTALYSLILNGFSPAGVVLYGEYQWSRDARECFGTALPFARVVPVADVLRRIGSLGGARLVEWARRYWWVMKTCIALLEGADDFCILDDDLFVLDTLDDALAAFRSHDLVYAPDTDHGKKYSGVWARGFALSEPLKTGTLNAALYWCKPIHETRRIAGQMLHVSPVGTPAFCWEQGFLAAAYSTKRSFGLPSTRYFYPLFDGLPGGMLGYDYLNNPCGFATVHFGGLQEKPGETLMEYLIPEILETKALRSVLHEPSSLARHLEAGA